MSIAVDWDVKQQTKYLASILCNFTMKMSVTCIQQNKKKMHYNVEMVKSYDIIMALYLHLINVLIMISTR